MTRTQVAEKIARSLEKREQLLKLLSMNNYDMEANSRPEQLTTFKTAYGRSMADIRGILSKFCPEMSEEEKQEKAMEEAQVGFVRHSVYEITYNCLIRLLEQ